MFKKNFWVKFNKYDIILIVAVFIIIFFTTFKMFFINNKSNYVEVYVNNSLFGSFGLNHDRVIVIKKNVELEIKNSKIRFIENDCPNKFCIKQGWSSNMPLVCVPNKIIVKFVNKNKKQLLTY